MTTDELKSKSKEYGLERLKIASQCKSMEDWQKLWTESKNKFPFKWGDCWKQCIEYSVDDYTTEVGFFIDILGLQVNAFGDDFAMFTSPGHDFYFAVVPKAENSESTPPGTIKLQFMLDEILKTTDELKSRGIKFEKEPEPFAEGAALYHGYFRSPHGIQIDLWGVVSE